MAPAELADAAPERRLVTVLFADLSGYTALCARLDPEEVHAVVRPAMRALRSAVESFGGTVPGIQGDGFMAVFGAPIAHEDDAERAVRAAFALQRTLAETNERARIVLPGLHVGINSGEVLVWPGDRGEISVVGDSVNVASRLCGLAQAGEIYVGRRTVELTAGQVDYSAPVPSLVKGLPEPVLAFPAAGMRADAVAGRRTLSVRAGFVGRASILRALDGLLDEARATGTSRVALVAGEAGYGKSRLAFEWTGSYDDVTVIVAGCSSYDDEPLSPWSSVAPAISELPAGSDDDRATAAVSVLGDFLRPLAHERPVIVVLDDVHLASADARAALERLAMSRLALPVVFLALARPEVDDIDVPTIALPPLEDDEMCALLDAMVGRSLPAAATDVLLQRSGGSPLFLEECVAHLVESGHVVVAQDSVSVDSAGVGEIPNSMRQFIAARLDALPAPERSVVQDAAVAGDVVWDTWLQVLDPERDVPALLAALERRGLLRRRATSAVAGANELSFKHALIREVAYESLARSTRSSRHRSLAEWLAHAASPQGGLPPAVLAYHYATAWDLARYDAASGGSADCGLAVGAVHALTGHVEAIGDRNPRRAEAVLTRALDIVSAAAECFPAATRVDLAVSRARQRVDLGDFPGAVADAESAEELSGDLPAHIRGHAELVRARALANLSQVVEAAPLFEDAIAIFRGCGDLAGTAEAVRHAAANRRLTDRRSYIRGLHDAHAAYVEAGDLAGQRSVAADLCYELTMEGGPAYRRWLAVAEAATDLDSDVRTRASLRRTEAFMAQNRGERRRALDLAALAYADAEAVGGFRITVDALICRLEATAALGLTAENARLAEEALELAERLSLRRFRALVHAFTARAALLERRRPEADRRLAEARRLLAEIGATEEHDTDVVELAMARDSGDWASAVTLGQRVVDTYEGQGDGLYAVPLRLDVARSVLGDDPRRALDALVEVLDATRRHDTPQYGALAAACLEQAQLLTGTETSQRIGVAPERSVELDATVAENAGLRSARRGEWSDALTSFTTAAETWSRLGATVWLARALTWQGEAARVAGAIAPPDLAEVVAGLLADLGSPEGLSARMAGQLRDAAG